MKRSRNTPSPLVGIIMGSDSDVPTLRNVPLAHALLRVEVGEQIPEELYDAVAEVLNFVYGLKNPTPAART